MPNCISVDWLLIALSILMTLILASFHSAFSVPSAIQRGVNVFSVGGLHAGVRDLRLPGFLRDFLTRCSTSRTAAQQPALLPTRPRLQQVGCTSFTATVLHVAVVVVWR